MCMCLAGFWKRSGAFKLVSGIVTNKIRAIGSGRAEAALKPTVSKTLVSSVSSEDVHVSSSPRVSCLQENMKCILNQATLGISRVDEILKKSNVVHFLFIDHFFMTAFYDCFFNTHLIMKGRKGKATFERKTS